MTDAKVKEEYDKLTAFGQKIITCTFNNEKPRRLQEINIFTHLHIKEYCSEINNTYIAAVTAAHAAHKDSLKINLEAKMAKVERMTYQRLIIKTYFDTLMADEAAQVGVAKRVQHAHIGTIPSALHQEAATLQRSADAEQKFKMYCSILLCELDENGDLQVYSVYAGKMAASGLI
ncbi:hypothetical protein BDZ89DRAFT_1141036 [Hymenopellis radicata]|nr:hypothetical protein BDZ89DRAFT_1141036 [Hymenopellis radicata]